MVNQLLFVKNALVLFIFSFFPKIIRNYIILHEATLSFYKVLLCKSVKWKVHLCRDLIMEKYHSTLKRCGSILRFYVIKCKSYPFQPPMIKYTKYIITASYWNNSLYVTFSPVQAVYNSSTGGVRGDWVHLLMLGNGIGGTKEALSG